MSSWTIPDSMTFDQPIERLKPAIENEEDKKKAFGQALGSGKNPFEAATLICGQNTSEALWISQRWLNDPIVLASKEDFTKTVYNPDTLLDGDELSAKLLRMAEEKDKSNTFYILEGKDRVALLKLYAEVRGLTGKQAVIDNSTKTFNKMVVKFVSPEKKQDQIIEQSSNEAQLLNNKSGLKLKLVS